MPVYYNNKSIIPAPHVNIEFSKNRIGDSRQLSDQYNITLTGTILPFFSGLFDDPSDNVKGSFNEQTALAQILSKQNEILDLFAQEGFLLEIQGIDGSQPIKFMPKIDSISFGEGTWVNICSYTVSLTSDKMLYSGGDTPDQTEYADFYDGKLLEAVCNYSIANNSDGTATVTRSISSKGALVYDDSNPGQLLNSTFPYQWASGWCIKTDNSGNIDSYYSEAISNCVPNYSVIESSMNSELSKNDGSYSITRNWLVSNTGVYLTTQNYTKSEPVDDSGDTLSISLEIQGIGFTPSTKYTNAISYWTDNSCSTKEQKITHLKSLFSYAGANDGTWNYNTFSETRNKQNGSITVNVDFAKRASTKHTYTVDANTDWKSLPEKTLTMNGTIIGVGESASTKKSDALSYYGTINFPSLASGVAVTEFGTSDILYLQTQSLSVNNDTGEITYSRNYTSYEVNYKDTWNLDYSQSETGNGDTISVNGLLTGLSHNKEARWSQVYSAFNTNFSDDSTVWTNKVVGILGANAPDYGYVNSRSFGYNNITGEITYKYDWETSPTSSGEIDYSIDCSYDRAADSWIITLNGTVHGAGNTSNSKVENAYSILPGEQAAWNHAYNVAVSRLDDNAGDNDDPKINPIPNQRYMISRNFGTDEQQGIITFSYVWNTSETASGYINESSSDYSWEEQIATETVTVNGTIKAQATPTKTAEESLNDGWTAIYNNGDPVCPAPIFSTRHRGYFADQTYIQEQLPTLYPISSTATPTSVLSFNRYAALNSIAYSKDNQKSEISYSFIFSYKSWPYDLPLWLTDVVVSFNKTKSIDLWVQKQIIGKRTGPIHQDLTSKTPTAFDFSATLTPSKRKADQFGSAINILLEEYIDYVLREVFLSRSGYAAFNYSISDGANQNCYFESDSINYDIITGSVSRNTKIVMLDILT